MRLGCRKLTVRDEVVLPALRLGEQRVLLRELVLAPAAHAAPKHLLPHPVDLEVAALPALLALRLVGDGAEPGLKGAGLLPLQLSQELHALPLGLGHVFWPLRLVRVGAGLPGAAAAAPGQALVEGVVLGRQETTLCVCHVAKVVVHEPRELLIHRARHGTVPIPSAAAAGDADILPFSW